jgi:hypothetical protein
MQKGFSKEILRNAALYEREVVVAHIHLLLEEVLLVAELLRRLAHHIDQPCDSLRAAPPPPHETPATKPKKLQQA